MPPKLTDQEKNFIEEVGVGFEQTGMPRMAGRVLGCLFIATPPYQSPSELAEILMASKGSISTTLHLLLQIGLIERFIIPGVRHDYFRLQHDVLQRVVHHGFENEIKTFRQLAEHGLELLKGETSIRRQLLEEMRDRYTFLEQEFPALLERWGKRQAKNKPKPPPDEE